MLALKDKVAASVMILGPVVVVLLLAKPMAPVKNAEPAEFWAAAFGVDLKDLEIRELRGTYEPRDGWYIYYFQDYHGQILYRVPRDEVVAAFPEVVRKIKVAATNPASPPIVHWAATVLDRNSTEHNFSPDRFLTLLKEERLSALRAEGAKGEWLAESAERKEKSFPKRWSYVRRYWMTILFECAFFPSLATFTLWPALKAKGKIAYGLHFALFPFLLMLPFYCGYAGRTFTSAGPGGGVLYPWVISCFPHSSLWIEADKWALQHFPRVLTYISQPSGPMLSISGGSYMGPVTALLIGIGVGTMIVAIWCCVAKMKESKEPNGNGPRAG